MFEAVKHKTVLINILKDIYSNVELRTILGFKGGTAAMLFYNLPRLSVDLDFDLLAPEKKTLVLTRVKTILKRHGRVDDSREKRNTLFFLLNYEKGKQAAKLEISKRKSLNVYEFQNYLGMPMLVIRQADAAAGKLSALITRRRFAMRDVYDTWFYLKHQWPINPVIVKKQTDLSVRQALQRAGKKVSKVKKNQVLQGLGELLDEKQKLWAKDNLVQDLVFLLKLRVKLGAIE